ncbi:hypothetical protein DJ010_19405 [Nocardioides silvaticus]|uniref:Uncharacterized protein n=1 Tax=Nocardioides silvaticus TaxID=2201891 RepID=A0A316TDE4_9ACTN|nr:hypothetical protein [Nocardioides silvaticus]PWN01325.1 hypothetical protein DJ010_19405 [Nocardioides silvaticus]
MDYLGLIIFAVAAVGFAYLVHAMSVAGSWDEKDREARRQAELDRRGEAALEALRELGRKYPRPKDY